MVGKVASRCMGSVSCLYNDRSPYWFERESRTVDSWDAGGAVMSLVKVDYKGCENCKHEVCEEFEEPCVKCKNNFVFGTEDYCTHEFLWEDATSDNPVTHPTHYTQGKVQCIDAMESAFGKEAVATWCKLNAFKYIWREQHKNGMEDIDKALWYLNKYKELSA